MAVLDTSFLIAKIKADDRFHEEAGDADLAGHPLWIPAEIWLEFCELTGRSLGGLAKMFQNSVLEQPFQIRAFLDPTDLVRLTERNEQLRPLLLRAGLSPLSLFDLVVCLVAQRLNDAILTFDQGIIWAVRNRHFPGARIA